MKSNSKTDLSNITVLVNEFTGDRDTLIRLAEYLRHLADKVEQRANYSLI